MPISRYEELDAWVKSKDLAVEVYRASSGSTFARDFGLRDQIRRAAVSVPSNVAEGFDRFSAKEFRRFLLIARGSAAELRTQLVLAHELGYVDLDTYQRLATTALDVSRLLTRPHSSIRTR